MAARLARAGADLAVWNRTRAKAEPLAELGATVVDAIADLRGRDVVFTMVSTPADLEQVLTGDGGLLADPGSVPARGRRLLDRLDRDLRAAMRAACAERRHRSSSPRRSAATARSSPPGGSAWSCPATRRPSTGSRPLLEAIGQGVDVRR